MSNSQPRTAGFPPSSTLAAPPAPVTPGERGPEELRVELDALRAELSATVDVLANRLNVPARVQEKTREVTDRARQSAAQVADRTQQTARAASRRVARLPVVGPLVSRRPFVTAAAVVLAVGSIVAGIATWGSR